MHIYFCFYSDLSYSFERLLLSHALMVWFFDMLPVVSSFLTEFAFLWKFNREYTMKTSYLAMFTRC